jgi:hypothetical protein
MQCFPPSFFVRLVGCLSTATSGVLAQTIVANHSILGNPIDLAISPDETYAVVRTASASANVGRTYFVDLLLPGYPLTITESQPTQQILGDNRVCDMIATIGNRVAAISWNIGLTPLPQVKLFENNPWNVLYTSNVHLSAVDLEVGLAPLTMNSLAVVRHDATNGIGAVSFWDLTAGNRGP